MRCSRSRQSYSQASGGNTSRSSSRTIDAGSDDTGRVKVSAIKILSECGDARIAIVADAIESGCYFDPSAVMKLDRSSNGRQQRHTP